MPRVIFRNCYNVISRAVGRVKFDITSGIYAKYHHKSCHYLFIHKRFVIFTCIKHFKLMYQSIPFSRFYTCISSLLIKIELHRERHPFMFIKLFITCNFTAPIILISISFKLLQVTSSFVIALGF